MPYVTVEVDDLQSGHDVRGFAAEAELGVQYWDDGAEWVIRDAMVMMRSNGVFVWRTAKPDLFCEIRDEVLASPSWVEVIRDHISEHLYQRQYGELA